MDVCFHINVRFNITCVSFLFPTIKLRRTRIVRLNLFLTFSSLNLPLRTTQFQSHKQYKLKLIFFCFPKDFQNQRYFLLNQLVVKGKKLKKNNNKHSIRHSLNCSISSEFKVVVISNIYALKVYKTQTCLMYENYSY